MTGRCRKCNRFTATRSDRNKVGALTACRVGFIQEAIDGLALSESVLLCLPCIRNMQPANTTH